MRTPIACSYVGQRIENKYDFFNALYHRPLILKADTSTPQLMDIMRVGDRLAVSAAQRESFVGFYNASLHSSPQVQRATLRMQELIQKGFLPHAEIGDLFIEKHKDLLSVVGSAPPFLQITFPSTDVVLFGKTRSLYGLALHGSPQLTLLSGPCLYSTFGVVLIDENGRREEILNPHREIRFGAIADIIIQSELSFYEFEFIHRIGRIISTVASGTDTRKIQLHVPYEEYLLYLLARGCHGLIPINVKNRYQTALFERGEMLKKAFLDQLDTHSIENIEVEFISPLACIRATIEKLFEQHDYTEGELVQQLVDELIKKSSVFRDLLPLCEVTKLQDISYVSYLCGYLSASRCDVSDRRACLIIQNAPEEATFSTLVERIKAHKIFSMRIAGLFTHEKIFLLNKDGDIFHPYFSDCFVSHQAQGALINFV